MTQKKKESINVTISKKAHRKMKKDGLKGGARRNLRQQVNFINNLPIDL